MTKDKIKRGQKGGWAPARGKEAPSNRRDAAAKNGQDDRAWCTGQRGLPPMKSAPNKNAARNRHHFATSGSRLAAGGGSVVGRLLDGCDLRVLHYNWSPEIAEEFEAAIEKGFFVHAGNGERNKKSRWFGTGGPEFKDRVKEYRKGDMPHLTAYVTWLKGLLNANIVDSEFVVNYPEAAFENEVTGFMLLHDDDYRITWRIMGTIGGKDELDPKIKTMTFQDVETGAMDTITIPHGTVIVMNRIASGAVKNFQFKHGIDDAEGTYTHGIQLISAEHEKGMLVAGGGKDGGK